MSRSFLALAALLALPSSAAGAPPVAVVELFPAAGQQGSPLEISFEGRAVPGGTAISLPAAVPSGNDPAGETVTAYLQALASGAPERILSFWNPVERQAVRGRMQTAAMSKSRELFASVRQVELFGEVSYGAYRIVLAELATPGGSLPRAYPLKETGGKLYVTDELSADLFFGEVATALADRLAKGTARLGSAAETRAAAPSAPRQDVEIDGGPGAVRVSFSPPGTRGAAAVTLLFAGDLHRDGLALDRKGPASAEAARLAEYFQAWKTGTYDDVLSFWAPGQAAEFQKYFPRSAFEAHRKTYQAATRSQVLAELRYGTYRIVVVEHIGGWGAKAEVYAFRGGEGRPSLSYELLADPVFHLWRSSLADRAAQRFGR